MIFLAGISASGKSHAASLLAEGGKFVHLKASQLLARAGRPTLGLSKAEAVQNQKELLEIIGNAKKNENVILDGHVTIETTEGQIEVPDWFFDNLSIKKIICLINDPKKIAARRGERGELATETQIDVAQSFEMMSARRQADRLSIPYCQIAGENSSAFLRAILDR